MPEDQNVEPKQVDSFDPSALKQEIAAQNEQLMQSLLAAVDSKLTGFRDGLAAAQTTVPVTKADKIKNDIYELEEEKNLIGFDDEQASAMVNFVEKILGKKANTFKDDVISTVDKNLSAKEKKIALENDIKKKYPSVLDVNGALFRQAQKEFNDLSDGVKSSPEGTSIAIRLAADRLGISAIDLSKIQQNDAENQTNGNGRRSSKSNEATEHDLSFAKSFGVNPETFKKHLAHANTRPRMVS